MAKQPVYFPEGKSANILRGALGTIFRRVACLPPCTGVRDCELRGSCPYARTFEPSARNRDVGVAVSTPSGLADWPRPFVFRARHLDGCRFEAGARFHFDLHLFELTSPAVGYLVLAFSELAREGLGPRRGCVELAGVSQLDEHRRPAVELYDRSVKLREPAAPLELGLAPELKAVTRLRVRFITPTELKSGHEIAERPEFATLAARIRDRISTLSALYGEGPLDIDFRAFGKRAAGIRITHCRLRQQDVIRRSSRTGQRHPIGGFKGEAEYEGELTEFVPYLRAAQWTGVGRQTVWGKGEIATECLG